MHKRLKAMTAVALTAALLWTGTLPLPGGAISKAAAESAAEQMARQAQEASDELFNLMIGRGTYARYAEQYADAAKPAREIIAEAGDYSAYEGDDFRTINGFEGMDGVSVYTGEQGYVEWSVEVPETGLYHFSLLYYPVEGKSSSIERSVLINGIIPFEEAAFVQFDRIWDNKLPEVQRDNRGNDLRPQQTERPAWREAIFKDTEGYYEEPFAFHLTQGTHSIRLLAQREPMVVKHLRIYQERIAPSYAEAVSQYEAEGLKPVKDRLLEVQGEHAVAKSSPTLYPVAERASSAVYPYSASEIRINTIGGYNWRVPGQWIEWELDVPETGLYQLAFKTQQNWIRGIYSTRKLTIDGEVPFKEAERLPFHFKSGYRIDVLGEEEPYLFKLEQGKRTLRLETSLGVFAPLVREVEESLYNLNDAYRKMLMITGPSPDPVRDYRLERQIPNLMDIFAAESARLTRIADEVEQASGSTGEQEALLKTMASQLDIMIEKPDTIPRRLTQYKINTGGIGTWLLRAREMPLEIDVIYASSPGAKLPAKGMGFFAKLKHEFVAFVYSFFIDYNEIGSIGDGRNNRSITVWIGSGRDQANTIKAMIDESFTPQTGISVNLKLVQMHTLLPATLAGQGPDVAMQIGNDLPVNYGMRNAAVDLTQFDDFHEVADRFRPSALVPYTFEEGVFALPETQTFNMLFYRKDVLKELGLKIPQTWEDINNLLAVLNKNRMSFGLPLVQQPAYPGENIPINSVYAMLLMQNGGQFYRNDNKESDLDSRIGIETFKVWTEFYTDYKLEREFDFANRFRTGEMPVGIADYTTYNQLTVFAPEIRGLWGFVPVPGTVQGDGTLNRDVPSGGNGTIMLEGAEHKDAAWEFMKWWTNDEAQTMFGREMEGLMGAAARYPTANIAALDKLPWPVMDYQNLKAQFQSVRGIPEVPGGYFTGRHMINAFYRVVVSEASEPREAMMDYVQYIHDEITSKRKEFGLPQ